MSITVLPLKLRAQAMATAVVMGVAPNQYSPTSLVAIEAENFHTHLAQGAHAWRFATTPSGFSGPGTVYAVHERVLFDAAVGCGLTRASADFLLTVGVTITLR